MYNYTCSVPLGLSTCTVASTYSACAIYFLAIDYLFFPIFYPQREAMEHQEKVSLFIVKCMHQGPPRTTMYVVRTLLVKR